MELEQIVYEELLKIQKNEDSNISFDEIVERQIEYDISKQGLEKLAINRIEKLNNLFIEPEIVEWFNGVYRSKRYNKIIEQAINNYKLSLNVNKNEQNAIENDLAETNKPKYFLNAQNEILGKSPSFDSDFNTIYNYYYELEQKRPEINKYAIEYEKKATEYKENEIQGYGYGISLGSSMAHNKYMQTGHIISGDLSEEELDNFLKSDDPGFMDGFRNGYKKGCRDYAASLNLVKKQVEHESKEKENNNLEVSTKIIKEEFVPVEPVEEEIIEESEEIPNFKEELKNFRNSLIETAAKENLFEEQTNNIEALANKSK